MIIAINGDLINTNKIYKINEIKSDILFHHKSKLYFRILMLNNITLKYEIEGDFTMYSKLINYKNAEKYQNKILDSTEYKSALNKITRFRDKIVKVWSKNQSKIPQINIDDEEIPDSTPLIIDKLNELREKEELEKQLSECEMGGQHDWEFFYDRHVPSAVDHSICKKCNLRNN